MIDRLLGRGGHDGDGDGDGTGTVGSTEADSDRPSETEIARRIEEARERLDRFEAAEAEARTRYRDLLAAGADADPTRRRVLGVRARVEKFKGRVFRLKRLLAFRGLLTWTVADGVIEAEDLLAAMDEEPLPQEVLAGSPDDLQERVDDAIAGLQADFAELDEFMAAFDVDPDRVALDTMEEERVMAALASEDLEAADLDVEPGDREAVAGDADGESVPLSTLRDADPDELDRALDG
jgi:hypothetical protein